MKRVVRALAVIELNSYIAILAPPKHKKNHHPAVELNNFLFQSGIKIIQVAFFSFFFFILLSHRAFLSHSLSSHLKLISDQNSLKLTLSTSLSQAHSFTAADPTHPQHCRHRSSTSPTHQPSQATDQPLTHAAIRLKPTDRVMRSKLRERCSVIGNQSIGEDVDSVGSIDV